MAFLVHCYVHDQICAQWRSVDTLTSCLPVSGASSVFLFACREKERHFWSLLAGWQLLLVNFSPQWEIESSIFCLLTNDRREPCLIFSSHFTLCFHFPIFFLSLSDLYLPDALYLLYLLILHCICSPIFPWSSGVMFMVSSAFHDCPIGSVVVAWCYRGLKYPSDS